MLAGMVAAQSRNQTPVTIERVRVLLNQTPPALEIICDRPVVPAIRKLDNPPRLAIDIPGAVMSTAAKRIDVHSDQISAVRLNQYQKSPPVVRIVIDLLHPAGYDTSASGNLLTVHLRPEGSTAVARGPAQPPSVTALTRAAPPPAVPVSARNAGVVVLAGSRLANGSSVTASSETTVLRLARGGEVRVCPRTTVSVTASRNGNDLMLGMSTGALEGHYHLDSSADSVVTPDFRILLAGPGEFHYAISADARGNTCVRALPGNTASAIVSELMGDGTFQVKASDQVMFHAGRLNAVDRSVSLDCGCPEPPVPVMRAATPLSPPVSDDRLPSSTRMTSSQEQAGPVPPPVATSALRSDAMPQSQMTLSAAGLAAAVLPASQPNDVHVQVDAPLIFRANEPPPPPTPLEEAQLLPLRFNFAVERPQVPVLPPPPAAQAEKPARHGFFGKIKGFFAAIFR